MDDDAPGRNDARLESLVALGDRALAAATLGEVWGDVTGFLAVQLETTAVIAIEVDEQTRALRVRAVSGASPWPVGATLEPGLGDDLLAPAALDALSGLPSPVHVAPVGSPGNACGPLGALLVAGSCDPDPGAFLALAAHILSAASGRLRVTARALRDSAFLARATTTLSRARGVNPTRRAVLQILEELASRSVLLLVDRRTDERTIHPSHTVEDAAALLEGIGLGGDLPDNAVLSHGQVEGTVVTLPLRVGGKRLGAVVLLLDASLERASERVPVFETLTDRLALALHNAWLLEEARREATSRANLLAVVSHDLGSPLASIMLHAEVLRRRLVRDGIEGFDDGLGNIIAAGRQMDRLIGDLRDEEAARRGQLRMEARPCDLVATLDQMVSTWSPRARQARVTLDWAPPVEAVPEVHCDPTRVRQALENLLSNALNVTPPGGRIQVRAERGGDELRISVIDTGPGVPREARASIFESFYRGATTRYQGLGLGLSIARSIVQMHHGALELESPETGACFTMRLPLRRPHPAPRSPADPPP